MTGKSTDLDDSIALTTQIEMNAQRMSVWMAVKWWLSARAMCCGVSPMPMASIRYLDILKRNASRIDNPDLIYPSQIFALPETATSGQ